MVEGRGPGLVTVSRHRRHSNMNDSMTPSLGIILQPTTSAAMRHLSASPDLSVLQGPGETPGDVNSSPGEVDPSIAILFRH